MVVLNLPIKPWKMRSELQMSGANTQVILLHVTPNIPIPLTFERLVYSAKTGKSIPLTQYIQELTEEMEENASKMLEEERRKFAHHNINIETISLNGYPAEKIIDLQTKRRLT